MKRISKRLIPALALMMAVLFSVSAAAAGTDIAPISAELPENDAQFAGITGTITSVEERTNGKYVGIKLEGDGSAYLVVSQDTFVLAGTSFELGAKITGYYDMNAPIPMIYPPQYSARVIAPVAEAHNVFVGRFNEELVSADNFLKLLNTDKAEIVTQSGKPFTGELAGRVLVVEYGAATRSIPAQTNPNRITVLYEQENLVRNELDAELIAWLAELVPEADYLVNGKALTNAPAAYVTDRGVVMVPLRAFADALGYTVVWNAENRSVQIGDDAYLTLGQDRYVYRDDVVISLAAVPELSEDGVTFVPIEFFRTVLRFNNAYFFEGQIVVNNEEPMN